MKISFTLFYLSITFILVSQGYIISIRDNGLTPKTVLFIGIITIIGAVLAILSRFTDDFESYYPDYQKDYSWAMQNGQVTAGTVYADNPSANPGLSWIN